MWAAGVAAGAAAVAWWRIVGPGFIWLAGGVVLLFGLPAAILGAGPIAWLGLGLASLTLGLAQRSRQAAMSFAGAAAAYVVAAAIVGHPLLAVTGALALGGITSEMLLGHWYLVDPRLPRWALQRLDIAAGAGLVADVAALLALGVLDWPEADAVLGWAFVALAAMSGLLVVAVWFALREPRYTGVMAATGLSYLAVITMFGAAVTGRIVVG